MGKPWPIPFVLVALVLLGSGVPLGGCAAPSVYLGPEDPAEVGADSAADGSADARGADTANGGDATDAAAGDAATDRATPADTWPDSTPAPTDTAGDVAVDIPPEASADAGPDVTDAPAVPDGPCGVPGGACCGALCGAGATCAEGRCVACGSAGAPCCGVLCGGGLECVAGACRDACIAAEARCAGACVNTATSSAHCGACGRACAATETCTSGVCAPRCAAPMLFCGGVCVAAQTDTANCGACGRVCAASEACVAGVCRGPFRGVAEDFEGGAWAAPPWVDTGVRLGGVGPEVVPGADAECAHDGGRGGYEAGSYRVRPDVAVGFPGQRVSMWYRHKPTSATTREPRGVVFLGVGVGPGAWLVVLPTGGVDFSIERSAPLGSRELVGYTRERLPFSGGWFRVELSFAPGPTMTARLFDATGAAQVASLTVAAPGLTPGPLVLSTDWVCVDTVTAEGP